MGSLLAAAALAGFAASLLPLGWLTGWYDDADAHACLMVGWAVLSAAPATRGLVCARLAMQARPPPAAPPRRERPFPGVGRALPAFSQSRQQADKKPTPLVS